MAIVVPSQVVNLIDQAFPWAKEQKSDQKMSIYPDHIGVLYAISEMTAAISQNLVPLSPPEASKMNAALWTIRAQLESWHAHGKVGKMDAIRGIDSRNPVSVLRECLAKCPDEPIPVAVKEYAFVKDVDLRRSLLTDFGAVARALSNAEWKAATVLAGSCLEALLLWAIQESKAKNASGFKAAVNQAISRELKKAPSNNTDEWSLHELIEVSLDLGIITSDAAVQARLSKNFRNLIHPGRALRKATECNIGTAMAARAALEFISADLAKNFP